MGAPSPWTVPSDIPGRQLWVEAESYQWTNRRGNKVQIIAMTGYDYTAEDITCDIEWQLHAHTAGEMVAQVAVDEFLAVPMPSREEILASVNSTAWYWTQHGSMTARQIGLEFVRLQWAPAGGTIATVECGLGSFAVKKDKPGEVTLVDSTGLSQEQIAFVLRYVSYKAAEARLMVKMAS